MILQGMKLFFTGDAPMHTFIYILINIIFPIFVIALIGYAAQKLLKMDTRTISKINIYVFVPAVIFTKIYEAKISAAMFGTVLLYTVCIQVLLYLIGTIVSKILKY